MVNARIQPSNPNARIQGITVNVRVSNFQTTKSGETVANITPGMPIGLLLALTYAGSHSSSNAFYGDYRPTVRIKSI